jgi:hypothetical protein
MVSSFKVLFTEIVYTLLFLQASTFYSPATSSILGSDTFLISLSLSLSLSIYICQIAGFREEMSKQLKFRLLDGSCGLHISEPTVNISDTFR